MVMSSWPLVAAESQAPSVAVLCKDTWHAIAKSRGAQMLDAPCELYIPFTCMTAANLTYCTGSSTLCEATTVPNQLSKCSWGPWEQDWCAPGAISLMGSASLTFFYVLSGFVLGLRYAARPLRRASSGGTLREEGNDLPSFETALFLRKRFSRLAPMYYLTVAVGTAMSPDAVFSDIPNFILTLVGCTSWTHNSPLANPPAWTISTFLFLYVCFPFLAPWVHRLDVKRIKSTAWILYLLRTTILGVCWLVLYVITDDLSIAVSVRKNPPLALALFVMGNLCAMARLNASGKNSSVPEEELYMCVPDLVSFHEPYE